MRRLKQEEIEELRNLSDQSPRLLNLTQMSAALGVSYSYVLRMKKCGCPFPGNRSTISAALTWLKNNPDFKPYGQQKEKAGPYGLPISNFTTEELQEYASEHSS